MTAAEKYKEWLRNRKSDAVQEKTTWENSVTGNLDKAETWSKLWNNPNTNRFAVADTKSKPLDIVTARSREAMEGNDWASFGNLARDIFSLDTLKETGTEILDSLVTGSLDYLKGFIPTVSTGKGRAATGKIAKRIECKTCKEAEKVERKLISFLDAPGYKDDIHKIFRDFVANTPLLSQYQYTLDIGDHKTTTNLDNAILSDFTFRVKNISLPELKRDSTNVSYGHSTTGAISQEQAYSENKAEVTLICDSNLQTLEYLLGLTGSAICETPNKTENKVFNLSTVADHSYDAQESSCALLKIRSGREINREVAFEARSNQFAETNSIKFSKLPCFILYNFRFSNLKYSFKFDSTTTDAKLLEIKATVTWTEMNLKWVDATVSSTSNTEATPLPKPEDITTEKASEGEFKAPIAQKAFSPLLALPKFEAPKGNVTFNANSINVKL